MARRGLFVAKRAGCRRRDAYGWLSQYTRVIQKRSVNVLADNNAPHDMCIVRCWIEDADLVK
jgi:hypothetical protein